MPGFNDQNIRAISLVGIGGVGKTSLVGHWLKTDNADLFREVEGLLYWSFYVEKDVDVFLRKVIEFIEEVGTKVEFTSDSRDPLSELERNFPKLPPLVLILDGLRYCSKPSLKAAATAHSLTQSCEIFCS